MKTHFVHAKITADCTLPKDLLKLLVDKPVGLVSNIQHLHMLKQVKEQLPKSLIAGQVLGCRADTAARIKDKVDCFLYVGTGRFHPIKVGIETGKKVYCFDPCANGWFLLEQKTIDDHHNRRMGALNNFYHAERVGILVTTKVGQNDNKINRYSVNNKMKAAQAFMARNDGKKYYVFAFDTLRMNDLEDFPFIQVWINTACSRIADEKINMVNSDEIFAHEAMANEKKDTSLQIKRK